MKNLAITVITMGMLAPACGGRGTPQEVLHPVPAFAEYEPQRAPLLADEGELEAEAAVEEQGALQGEEMPRTAIVIMGMTETPDTPKLDAVYFAFGSAILDPADEEQLGKAAQWLRQHPDQQVLIEGHTDAVGPSQYNLTLGEQRARAVRDYLIQLGVAEERMAIVSLGEAQPVSKERTDLNRRSEVVPMPEPTEPR